jgi:hypothetical protein
LWLRRDTLRLLRMRQLRSQVAKIESKWQSRANAQPGGQSKFELCAPPLPRITLQLRSKHCNSARTLSSGLSYNCSHPAAWESE